MHSGHKESEFALVFLIDRIVKGELVMIFALFKIITWLNKCNTVDRKTQICIVFSIDWSYFVAFADFTIEVPKILFYKNFFVLDNQYSIEHI